MNWLSELMNSWIKLMNERYNGLNNMHTTMAYADVCCIALYTYADVCWQNNNESMIQRK